MMTSASFGEMIDENYIKLMFESFSRYSEEEKKTNAELLEVLLTSDMGLDLLYVEAVRTKGASLKAHGISEEELKRNIEILKGWSVEDRLAFLKAGVDGDFEKINEINLRNQKKEIVIEKSAFLSTAKPLVKKYNKDFDDIEKHWSKDFVTFLNERGIISGKSEGEFAPDDNVKRAEIVTLVMKVIIADDSMIPTYDGKVEDIQSGKWYDKSMQNAAVLGVIAQNSSDEFQPEKFSQRAEVVDILVKSLKAYGISFDEKTKLYTGDFKDFYDVELKYRESMIIAINLGFINGVSDKMIQPNGLITRGQTAVVIKKMYDYILEDMK